MVLIERNAKQALQISDGLVLEQGQPASKTQRRQIFADPLNYSSAAAWRQWKARHEQA
jgi:ABC-type branched-subunit amino acid transport system ATPase component